MGVYTMLYAPIFNYNSMSQLIEKFEPGGKTTKPKLYNRGNEQINLDTFANEATIEATRKLAGSRLKDSQKEEVMKAVGDILQGMYDGTFQYKIGGGYQNSIGYTNKTKGFDAAGIAAGILGDVLRRQSVYTSPEEETNSSKITWAGNSSIAPIVAKHIFGGDKYNVKDFVGLDYDPTTKQMNGTTNRANRFKQALEYVKNNFDSLFTSYSTADKTAAIANIDEALASISNDGQITANEYLNLTRATGFSDISGLFRDVYDTPTQETAGATNTPPTEGQESSTESEWLAANYPRRNTQLRSSLPITDGSRYGAGSIQAMQNHIKAQGTNKIFTFVNYLLAHPTEHLMAKEPFISYSPNPVNFSNPALLNMMLEILRQDGQLDQYADSTGNRFYIKGSYNKDRGTGLVWDMAKRAIDEVNIYDIPYFANYMHQQYLSTISSHKEGGKLIQKFQPGGPTPTVVDYLKYNTPYIQDFEDLYGVSMIDPYNAETGKGIFKGFKGSYHNAGANAGLNDYSDRFKKVTLSNGTEVDQAISDFTTADAIAALNSYKNKGKIIEDAQNALASIQKELGSEVTLQDIINKYNERVSTLRKWQSEKQNSPYGTDKQSENNNLFNSIYGNYSTFDKGLSDTLGSATYARLALAFNNLNDLKDQRQFSLNGFDDNIWFDNAGYLHIGEYGTVPTTDEDDPDDTDDDPYKTRIGSQNFYSTLLERLLQNRETFQAPNGRIQALGELLPTSVGIGRLAASLHTNNRVAKTVQPSLKPVLKDTYERYSPITGAFSEMQLRNQQAANILHQAQQSFTSDASLASARMLEGQRQANQLQAEGFLADDREIKRTQEEALKRQEDNMARRSEVANFNRASINQTNRERAQLEATRLKSNWQSLDNFLSGIENRLRSKNDENIERANNFYDKIASTQAEEWYNKVVESADRAYQTWLSDKNNEGKDPSQFWGPNGSEWYAYVKFKNDARNMANAKIYQSMAKRYKFDYTNPYTDFDYNMFDWFRRNQ